jgi:hypothetical protein
MFDSRGAAFGSPNHGGLTPAAPDRMCVCTSQKSVFADRRAHRNTRAGGVSPPWRQSACELETGNSAHCHCRRGLHTHGGLTPAALVSVRLCSENSAGASKKSFFAGKRSHRNTRAGGVSPPWRQSACELETGNSAHCHCRRGLHTHGGLTPAALGCVFDSRWTMFDSRGTPFGSRATAG